MSQSRPPIFSELQRTKAVLYARVSSKEQEKEGYSIPAQKRILNEYALKNDITVVEEFVDVETAKQSGRTNFTEMVRYLKSHRDVKAILVEKTDRLYRNLKDWVTIEELDIALHLVKEGEVISKESRSAQKFVHGIKALMAKNYIDNLSEEARKGLREKAEQGHYPSKAPVGYRNMLGVNGKRGIELDPDTAPVVGHLFAWYASGTLSLKELASKARKAGLVNTKTGGPIAVSGIHGILRSLFYTGEFEWRGKRYKGQHDPLVSQELWSRVQGMLDGRNARKIRGSKRNFSFSGVLTCGHCGCAVVGELKKQRYVYYHCSGFKGKCGDRYVREEVLEFKFTELLARISFGDKFLGWITEGLRESHDDQQREQKAALARMTAEFDRLHARLHAAYVDKLDGRIDGPFYDRISAEFREQQDRCRQEMILLQNADRSYIDSGVMLLELAREAGDLFSRRPPEGKRQLLNFLLSNCSLKDGELIAAYRQPFNLIAEMATDVISVDAVPDEKSPEHSVWLGNLDSNQDRRSQSPLFYH